MKMRMRPRARLAARLAVAGAAFFSSLAPSPGAAADASIEICGDLSARATEVAHHCRRALAAGGLSDRRRFAAAINLGAALHELGRPAAALEAFSDAADVAASIGADAGRSAIVQLHVGRAGAYEALRRRAEAEADWRAALAAAPDSFDVRLGLGAFHLRGGAHGAALEAFDAALALEPKAADALFNRGLTLIGLGRMDGAERDFTRLLTDNPNDAGALHHRARARAARDIGAALADFDAAIRLTPEWAEPWFRSALMLDRAGRVEEANFRFRRAFELGHKDPWLLERVRSLGG